LFLDLDRFKAVNDGLGHAAGDELLVQMSARLHTCLREGDTLARQGGDEFTILLDDVREPNDATVVADRIHQVTTKPFAISGHEVFATASIGIALSAPTYTRPEDLLLDADTAMYRAKAQGRARTVLFDATMRERAPPATSLTLNVNLSSKQLLQNDLLEHIDKVLETNDLQPHDLVLELTESTFQFSEQAAVRLAQLRARGVKLYMDDFGTGYSSLN